MSYHLSTGFQSDSSDQAEVLLRVNKYPTDLYHEDVLVGWISVNVWLVDYEDVVLVPGELAAGQLQDISFLILHTQTKSSQLYKYGTALTLKYEKNTKTVLSVADP